MSDAAETGQPTARATTDEGSDPLRTPDAANARAEELVDKLGERLGYFATVVTRRVEWAVARAREEAEDIWAEAQEIRRNKRL